MLISEPLGVAGAPNETLRALQAFFAETDLSRATLIFVTDSQGQRADARYALLVRLGEDTVVTVDAFGGRYGESGRLALQELARWAQRRGVTNVRETVVSTYDFGRVLREPDEEEVGQLLAASNPSDLDIYLS